MNLDWDEFSGLLSGYARNADVGRDSVLFRTDLNLSSIGFTEFVMDLEEQTGRDIDLDSLDASIRTAGQLYDRLFGAA